ncbi:MAG: riboflavin synthase [Gammaproteobacteria bacterium]|nr:MAG: riboflavin synthase [Gammaproteobacteria bacterium]
MFTGIVEDIGKIAQLQDSGGDVRLEVAVGKMPLTDVNLGDSIAVNGVCLTVTDLSATSFWADVSKESLNKTSLAIARAGTEVNLEKALMPTSRMGGHIVSGHVDGLGEVVSRNNDARSVKFKIKAPAQIAKYIAAKGSITVDGISLTINEVDGDLFSLNIIPQTLKETTLNNANPGRKVNLEVDIIARYLERLLHGGVSQESYDGEAEKLSLGFLAENGFVK